MMDRSILNRDVKIEYETEAILEEELEIEREAERSLRCGL